LKEGSGNRKSRRTARYSDCSAKGIGGRKTPKRRKKGVIREYGKESKWEDLEASAEKIKA